MSTTRRRDILLAQNPLLDNSELGFPNIKVDGVRQSFSQFGAIHRPHRFPPTLITAIGPGGQQGLFPTTFRLSLLTNTAIICIAVGQSPSVGAPPGVPEGDTGSATDVDTSVTRIAPHPRAFMFVGGTLPNPDGAGSSGNRTLVPPTQYASLVPLREDVNYLRTPGKETFRECAITSAGLSLAQWLPDSSISISVAPCNGASGPVDIIGGTNHWLSATWQPNGGGEAIYTAFGQTGFYPGTTRTISGLSSPFNLTAVVKRTEDTDGNGVFTRVIMPMATDPGTTWSGSVNFDDPGIPWQSIVNMVTYAVDNLIGGRDVELVFFCHDHEARSTIKLFSIYDSDSTYRRAKIDALAAAVGAPTPIVVIVPTQKPRGDWHDEKIYVTELSYPGMGAAERWRKATDPNSVVINPMAAASSNGADITNVHRDAINGYMDWGEYGARLWADARTAAADAAPLHVTRTNFTTAGAPSMQFGSKLVKVPLNHTDGVIDGYGVITDPGNGGVQVFTNGVTTSQTVDKALSTTGRSVDALASVSITAGVLTATLSADGSPYNRQIGFGFKNATSYLPMANNAVHTASWAVEDVFGFGLIGVFTMHMSGGAHGINPGEPAPVFQLTLSSGSFSNLTAIALPGTTGSVLKIQADTNPGHYVSGGSLVRNGADGLGPVRGLRHTIRRQAERHRSLYSGKVFYDLLLSDLHDIRVYGARPRMKDLLTDIGQ